MQAVAAAQQQAQAAAVQQRTAAAEAASLEAARLKLQEQRERLAAREVQTAPLPASTWR